MVDYTALTRWVRGRQPLLQVRLKALSASLTTLAMYALRSAGMIPIHQPKQDMMACKAAADACTGGTSAIVLCSIMCIQKPPSTNSDPGHFASN